MVNMGFQTLSLMFDSSYLNSGIIKRYSTGRNTYFSMAGVNFSQVMEKKMNKIFSVLLLVTFSFGTLSCSNSEDSSGANSQLGQVLDQPNSTDDENKIILPVVTIGTCELIDNSAIDNSTVDNSRISDNSSIKNSTVKNCSTVTGSIVDNSSTIDNSTISYSTINNSSICVQSTIDNSTIDNSTVCNSSTVQGVTTVRNSTIRNSSTVCYSTIIDNSTIDNSTVCYENVSFSIRSQTIRNQIMTEQTDPTVDNVSITSTTEAVYSVLNAGDNVSVTVFFTSTPTFSESVIVTDNDGIGVDNASGTPTLTLAVGSDNRTATYVSGSGTNALVFKYTIQSGDNDTDGISIGADSLALNSGTIRDASGNYAKITHSYVPDNDSYKVDNTGPTLVDNVSITSSTRGGSNPTSTPETRISSYKIPSSGASAGTICNANCYLYMTAHFNESVIVDNASGNPTLIIVIGESGNFVNRTATYTSDCSTTTALAFRYAIQSAVESPGDPDKNHLDRDGVSIDNASGITLNNGTIKDLAGNDATTLSFKLVGPNVLYQVK